MTKDVSIPFFWDSKIVDLTFYAWVTSCSFLTYKDESLRRTRYHIGALNYPERSYSSFPECCQGGRVLAETLPCGII